MILFRRDNFNITHFSVMKKNIIHLIGFFLCIFTIACRFSYQLADWYAQEVYPLVSAALSWISSFTSMSVQDFAIAGIIALAIRGVVSVAQRKWEWKRFLKFEAVLIMWTYVWFYIGWCTNYSRSSIYMRTDTERTICDEKRFVGFINEFTDSINKAWAKDVQVDFASAEEEMKYFYANVPKCYGLATPRSWQHPKTTIINGIYSSVGILGFMEPLFAESCLNKELPPLEQPFVHAHEYAHLLGISSEAECNWWAFKACTSSRYKPVRYSGYFSILPHLLSNARQFLDEAEYKNLLENIRPEVKHDLYNINEYWQQRQNRMFRDVHTQVYDIFLKGNNIPSGRKNYSEVIEMILSIDLDAPADITKTLITDKS